LKLTEKDAKYIEIFTLWLYQQIGLDWEEIGVITGMLLQQQYDDWDRLDALVESTKRLGFRNQMLAFGVAAAFEPS